jgi:hypothetical protein
MNDHIKCKRVEDKNHSNEKWSNKKRKKYFGEHFEQRWFKYTN